MATSVLCATSRQLEGLASVYWENCDIAIEVPGDSTELRGVKPRAIDREFAHELWKLSEKLKRYIVPKLKSDVREIPVPRRCRLEGRRGTILIP